MGWQFQDAKLVQVMVGQEDLVAILTTIAKKAVGLLLPPDALVIQCQVVENKGILFVLKHTVVSREPEKIGDGQGQE